MDVLRSAVLFLLAGICEIGGGWLVWQAWRNHRGETFALAGACLLVTYGIVATLQHAHFSRTYATYGGFFIVLSLLWGWVADGSRPDAADVTGAAIALVGACIMMYWPR